MTRRCPDPKLTPGDSVEGVTVEQLQEVGYSKEHRHVSEALRRAVFAEYGIAWESVMTTRWTTSLACRSVARTRLRISDRSHCA
jgi:hypothetical protein